MDCSSLCEHSSARTCCHTHPLPHRDNSVQYYEDCLHELEQLISSMGARTPCIIWGAPNKRMPNSSAHPIVQTKLSTSCTCCAFEASAWTCYGDGYSRVTQKGYRDRNARHLPLPHRARCQALFMLVDVDTARKLCKLSMPCGFCSSDFSRIAKRSSPGSASKYKDSEPMKQLCRQCHLTSDRHAGLPASPAPHQGMGHGQSPRIGSRGIFIQRCEQCLVDMRSSTHVEGFREDSLATQSFPIKSQTRLETLKERYKHERLDQGDLSVDPHSSSGRDLGYAVGISTCLRPTTPFGVPPCSGS